MKRVIAVLLAVTGVCFLAGCASEQPDGDIKNPPKGAEAGGSVQSAPGGAPSQPATAPKPNLQ